MNSLVLDQNSTKNTKDHEVHNVVAFVVLCVLRVTSTASKSFTIK